MPPDHRYRGKGRDSRRIMLDVIVVVALIFLCVGLVHFLCESVAAGFVKYSRYERHVPDPGHMRSEAREEPWGPGSRDGSRVAFTYRGDVSIVGTTGSAPPLRLTRTKETESAPLFSPDGACVGFVRGGQLYTHEFSTGVLAQISDVSGTNVREYEWSHGRPTQRVMPRAA
jgi:hypothetical protein